MPLTITSAMDVVAEVIRHMSSLPVTAPPPMEAPGVVSGVLAPVGHSYSLLHLLSFEVFHHTNLPPPLQAFNMVSQLNKLRVCRDKALMDHEPETPSLSPRVSPDTSPSPWKGG